MTDDDPGDLRGELQGEIRTVLTDVVEKGPEDVGASWLACAEAGLLGLAAPAEHGGEGLGLIELGVLVRETGARALDLPFRETLVCGLLTLVRCGSREQQELFVPRIAGGDLLVAPAVNEVGWALPERPSTRVEDDLLTGHKIAVPAYDDHPDATTLLMVTASDASGGPVVVLVDPASDRVVRSTAPSSRGTEATYEFDGAPVLGVLTEGAVAVLHQHVVAGALLQGDGLLAGARDLTAGYVKERVQFGRQLAEFQGVAMQVADVYVASRMLSLAAEEASRRVAAGEPAGADLAVGSFWFCDRAPSALQTCHHLHGGVGVDETYPLHRYFARVKDLSRLLGGTEATLEAVPPDRPDAANDELTPEQRAFKDEVRAYFSGLVSPEDRVEMMIDRHGEAYHRNIRQMGADGWLGVGWPVEYGGKGLGGIEQQIFANEAARADVHLPAVTLQTVGPTLQAFGTELQKEKFLKSILAGEVHFAIGYSEADAGTDLASLRTTARLDGDHYVVNGQKMWTTGGHAADYIWLAVRTDTEAPKHKGISVLIVDTKDPGYSWTPIITSDGSHHVNATYYSDVHVPANMLVGEENEGWRLITTQLNHERVMLGPAGRIEGLRDMVTDWARERTDPSGAPLLSLPDVRRPLARATAAFRVNELLNWQVAAATHGGSAAATHGGSAAATHGGSAAATHGGSAAATHGGSAAATHGGSAGSGASGTGTIADASASKVFASDEVQSLGLELERIVTSYGDPAEPETARLLRYLDATSKRNLVLTFGGGVNEVQRELIAMFGLGLPKVPR